MNFGDFRKLLRGYLWRQEQRQQRDLNYWRVIRWSGYVTLAVNRSKGKGLRQPDFYFPLPGEKSSYLSEEERKEYVEKMRERIGDVAKKYKEKNILNG